MDITKAKRIGFIQACKAITAGLIVAYFIMASVGHDPWWIAHTSFPLLLASGVVLIYLAGYIFGSLSGRLILIRQWPSLLVGIAGGFLIVWSAVFFTSVLGLLTEGLGHGDPVGELVYDYIGKPLMLVTGFGFITILLAGLWFGYTIKRKADQPGTSAQ